MLYFEKDYLSPRCSLADGGKEGSKRELDLPKVTQQETTLGRTSVASVVQVSSA